MQSLNCVVDQRRAGFIAQLSPQGIAREFLGDRAVPAQVRPGNDGQHGACISQVLENGRVTSTSRQRDGSEQSPLLIDLCTSPDQERYHWQVAVLDGYRQWCVSPSIAAVRVDERCQASDDILLTTPESTAESCDRVLLHRSRPVNTETARQQSDGGWLFVIDN